MPSRLSAGSARSPAPQPFSSAWLAGETEPEPPRTHGHAPGWLPDGRTLSAALVVLITVATALFTLLGNRPVQIPAETHAVVPTTSAPANVVDPPQVAATVPSSNLAPEQTPVGASALVATDAIAIGAQDEDAESPPLPTSGPLLPDYRIVTFYGHPHDPNMGIVGEYP